MRRLTTLLLFMAVTLLMLHDHVTLIDYSDSPAIETPYGAPQACAIVKIHEQLHAYTIAFEQVAFHDSWIPTLQPLHTPVYYESLSQKPLIHPPSV